MSENFTSLLERHNTLTLFVFLLLLAISLPAAASCRPESCFAGPAQQSRREFIFGSHAESSAANNTINQIRGEAMTIHTTVITSSLIAASLVSGTAHAALQGRDLNGSIDSFEAYYDTVLDVTWLANANVNGPMTQEAATAWAANLSFTDGVNTYDNWRLPTVSPVNGVDFNYSPSADGSTDLAYNISAAGTAYAASKASEMAHLFYTTLGNSGYFTPSDAVSGCYVSPSNTCLDNTAPFTNLQAYFYWSGTTYAPDNAGAYYFDFGLGSQSVADRSSYFYALAVSPGDIAAVPEVQTYALMLCGLGLVGTAALRKKKTEV